MSVVDFTTIIDALAASKSFVHVTSSGAGTQLASELWERPGASAWLSGASFPYSKEETTEFLGFTPVGVNHPTAVNLALEAYARAYRYGTTGAVGLAITASVASLVPHRGEHRIHGVVVTDAGAWRCDVGLEKGVGYGARLMDDNRCTEVTQELLANALGLSSSCDQVPQGVLDNAVVGWPVFTRQRTRVRDLPRNVALMPGAYDPPHEGHYGVAGLIEDAYNLRVVHAITMYPPHKDALTAQQVVGRAKLLRGRDLLVTARTERYIDWARAYPGVPLVLGADAVERMLDPKWGIQPMDIYDELLRLGTRVYVIDRRVGAHVMLGEDVLRRNGFRDGAPFQTVKGGCWPHSSTEARAALKA